MPTQRLRSSRIPSLMAGFAGLAMVALSAAPAGADNLTTGPDVTVIYVGGTTSDTTNWGADSGIRAYSVGTTSCNIGSAPVAWCDAGTCLGGTLQANDHPVIAQGMYRLKDGRFSQIGMSWLKHGWLSTNSNNTACAGIACQTPPGGGDQLGVGCTDTYNSGLNGGSGNPGTCLGGTGCRLGLRSEVNPTTGDFPMPYTNVDHPSVIDQRIQVLETDLDPALNTGALYWIEGQYIAADDGFAGNAFNNASYRKVTVGASPTFNLSLSTAALNPTVREKTALQAWKTADPSVEITNSDFCTAPVERFEVARKVTDLGGGTWHYEYAVRNMNSDHAAQRFSVDFPDGTPITNVGFKDIDHHSQVGVESIDWTPEVDIPSGTVSWATELYVNNNNANSLRFATLFNFWFDAAAAPATAQYAIELFKPLPPAVVDAGPAAGICVGGSVQIGTPAVAGQTYSWNPGGATTAQVNVSPAVTTIYTVTATNRCDSAQDTVTVTVDPGPDAPSLVGPANGSTGLQTPITLSWNASAGAADYTYQVATDAAFTSIVKSGTVAATTTNVTDLAPVAHFWRVMANAACSGVPSAAFTFTVTNALFNDGFESNDTSAWSLAFP